MLQPLSGDLCLSTKTVVFLNEISARCIVPSVRNSSSSTSKWLTDVINDYFEVKLVSVPQLINMSDVTNSVKNCSNMKSCVISLPLFCLNHPAIDKCVKLNSLSAFLKKDLVLKGAAIDLVIYQNGSEGIVSAETRIWTLPTNSLQISVKYLWANTTGSAFVRSGNPGYLNGKPILAGKKIVQYSNDSATGVKEAIQLTYDPKGWLTTFSNYKEHCSNIERQPIMFNDRSIFSCTLKLHKRFFDSSGCSDLQKTILDFLLGDNVWNSTSTEVNRFVGCYGNSRVEVLGDWVQVVVDSFPLFSTQASFERSALGLSCRGITTDLYIDIAFSKFGSFANPQAKIVGVLLRFGRPRDIFVRCYSNSCESSFYDSTIKLSLFANFVDLSTSPLHKFAEPPGLEAKLPHDFFYPFFSGRGSTVSCSWCSLVFVLSVSLLK